MSSDSVRVTIFGTEYTIKGDAGTETTKQVVQYVSSRITELQTAQRDNIKIAVLTAIQMAGELFETKAKYEAEVKKVREYEEKIKSITGMIGSAGNIKKVG